MRDSSCSVDLLGQVPEIHALCRKSAKQEMEANLNQGWWPMTCSLTIFEQVRMGLVGWPQQGKAADHRKTERCA